MMDIVIPAHNGSNWLYLCLKALSYVDRTYLDRVIVVDDNSQSYESTKLKAICNQFNVEYYINSTPDHGFGAACNYGISQASSNRVLLLNTDCLIAPNTITQLNNCFVDNVKLVCAISNNSANTTLPMHEGTSFLDMAEMLAKLNGNDNQGFKDIVTVVGNCLAVDVDFFKSVGGFSPEWGIGYGEESDLHMKAAEVGYRGVVCTTTYVYHHGGGTFNTVTNVTALRESNHKLFLSKWGNTYINLCKRNKFTLQDLSIPKSESFIYDIVFYLPGVDQTIGGMHSVISIVNLLILAGYKATVILVGFDTESKLRNFMEPILFSPIKFISDNAVLADSKVLSKIYVSTIDYSAAVVNKIVKQKGGLHVHYCQGFESYFQNGVDYVKSIDYLKLPAKIVTASNFLTHSLLRHGIDQAEFIQQPIDQSIFFDYGLIRQIDLCVVLRSAPDKGQWLLLDIILHLSKKFRILVLCSESYKHNLEGINVDIVQLPISQVDIAEMLNKSKVFIDLSIHEGYGLFPIQAGLCGCSLIVSNSGGVTEYLNNFVHKIVSTSAGDYGQTVEFIENAIGDYDKNPPVPKLNLNSDWPRYTADLLYEYSNNIILHMREIKIDPRKPLVIKKKATNFTYDLVLTQYKKFYRILPRRVHLALRMIVLGR